MGIAQDNTTFVVSATAIDEDIFDVKPDVADTTSAIQAMLLNAAQISLSDKTTLPTNTVDWDSTIGGWQAALTAVAADAAAVAGLFTQFDSVVSTLKAGPNPDAQKAVWVLMSTTNKTVLTSDPALTAFEQVVTNNAATLSSSLQQAQTTSSISNRLNVYRDLVEKVRTRVLFLKTCLRRLSVDISDVVMWGGSPLGQVPTPRIVAQIRDTGTSTYTANAAVLISWSRLPWPATVVLPNNVRAALPAPFNTLVQHS